MRNNRKYNVHVRTAVFNIKQHMDIDPLKYKSSSDLIYFTSTINRRILEKAFKAAYGYRIKEYQVKQRLNVSKLYLIEGMPIKRVAAKCYYRSHSAFSRAFKRQFNITPRAWLKI